MSAGQHGADHHHLHVPGFTAVHRLAPEAKLAGLIAFVTLVAVTPQRAVAAYAVDAAIVIAVLAAARIPLGVVLARLTVVLPFVAFAVLVPFVAGGDQVDVAGVTVSSDGLWAMTAIIAKAVLGAAASIAMSATTPIPDILHGLTRLRVPTVLVAMIAFMFRYLDIVADQLRRMRRAMTARGHDPRWLWQVRPIAASAGTQFVRCYERGERVHLAMVARGYTGSMPELDARRAVGADWIRALLPAVGAAVALVLTVALR